MSPRRSTTRRASARPVVQGRGVHHLRERASFKLIEVTFSKDSDEVKAAGSYRAFYDEFPESEVADLALNNAAVYFHNQGKVAKAMETRHIIVEKFPKSKYYKQQVASLGFDYETIADFNEASGWYEKLFSLDKEFESTKDAIYSAALFRAALGDWEQSIKNYQQFITAYPTDERVTAVKLDIAKTYEDHEKWTEASQVYYTFFTKPPEDATTDQVFFSRYRYGLPWRPSASSPRPTSTGTPPSPSSRRSRPAAPRWSSPSSSSPRSCSRRPSPRSTSTWP